MRCNGSAALTSPKGVLPQAAALRQLCSQLTVAHALRKLVLELTGRATYAALPAVAALSSLTQLDSLQICGIDLKLEDERLGAALRPLTRLTQLALSLNYDRQRMARMYDYPDETECFDPFPWEAAICGLTKLQELRVCSETDSKYRFSRGFAGALPAALSQLASLRHLEVLGMDEEDERDDDDQLLLAALPALEAAALRLRTVSGEYPGLGRQQQVVLSRVVSLRLALRDGDGNGQETYLPDITAPALTELVLDDIWLAQEIDQLSWLPDLPPLRRLVLKDLKTDSSQLPQGIMACSGLTELVLKRILLKYDEDRQRLCSLSAAGPYLSRLVRLNLAGNAFGKVPPCLAAATALQHLKFASQRLVLLPQDHQFPRMKGLDVLVNCTNLRSVNLADFRKGGSGVRRIRAAHPDMRVVY